jgi:hypothetical protein
MAVDERLRKRRQEVARPWWTRGDDQWPNSDLPISHKIGQRR